MILQRLYSRRTNYSSLDHSTKAWAKWRRRSDKELKEEIKEIDKNTAGLESAINNTLGGLTKKEIRARAASVREAGNSEKLRRILK